MILHKHKLGCLCLSLSLSLCIKASSERAFPYNIHIYNIYTCVCVCVYVCVCVRVCVCACVRVRLYIYIGCIVYLFLYALYITLYTLYITFSFLYWTTQFFEWYVCTQHCIQLRFSEWYTAHVNWDTMRGTQHIEWYMHAYMRRVYIRMHAYTEHYIAWWQFACIHACIHACIYVLWVIHSKCNFGCPTTHTCRALANFLDGFFCFVFWYILEYDRYTFWNMIYMMCSWYSVTTSYIYNRCMWHILGNRCMRHISGVTSDIYKPCMWHILSVFWDVERNVCVRSMLYMEHIYHVYGTRSMLYMEHDIYWVYSGM
jgi:hypothetical protein